MTNRNVKEEITERIKCRKILPVTEGHAKKGEICLFES
jgi:hypothetical protein